MLKRLFLFSILALLVSTMTACDFNSGNEGEDRFDAPVIADIRGHGEFISENVFVTGTAISFGFSAVDDDVTLIIAIQSPEGEPLITGRYAMGENTIEGVRYFASGSVVQDVDGTNLVLNAQAGGNGYIILETFSEGRAKGIFEFDAFSATVAEAGARVRAGMFDLDF